MLEFRLVVTDEQFISIAKLRAARVLWAGVHGITSLSTADKLSVVTTESANRLVDDLVRTYLAGLANGAVPPRSDAAVEAARSS